VNILPLNEDILSPSEDFVFKAILIHPDAKFALMDLISAIIGYTVTDVQIRNNELPSTDTEEKNERLDVSCVIDDGSQIDVEMQGSKLEGPDGGRVTLVNKAIYYLTDLHSSQKSKSVEYTDLVRTYQITFCAFNIFEQEHYLTQASLRDKDGLQISDQINMTIIELDKLGDILDKTADDMTSLEMWLIFLRYADDVKKRDLVNKILNRREAIIMAANVLREITQDEHMRAKRRSQRKWETDMANNYLVGVRVGRAEGEKKGEKKGEARGIKKGKAEGIFTVARNMLNEGFPIEAITKVTGLTNKEVEHLPEEK